jgi:hypothetical protein
MNWYWWVLVTFVAFGLGMASLLYFQKTRPPDRRQGDRRQGDRRAAGTEVRRATDRGGRRHVGRRHVDRRKRKPAWQLATVVVSALFLLGVGTIGYAESRVASIFAGSSPDLIDSGWTDCDTPITWSMDTSRLSANDASVARRQITGDLDKWADVSGLTFQYVGEVPTLYDDTTFVLTSNQHPSERHIYIAFMSKNESTLLDMRTVGFAAPTKVWKDSKQIVEGSAVFSIEFIKQADRDEISALYLHELGHVLGLGHGDEDEDVMYYLVRDKNHLSSADVSGIRAIVQSCKDRS